MRFFLLLFAACLANSAAGQNGAANTSAPGLLIITNLHHAPFPDLSRAEGHTYKGETFSMGAHYMDSTVAMFVPKQFRADPALDVVIHFHGWRNTATNAIRQFQLSEQLVASGRNAVLIVPQGPREAPDSGGGKLELPGGFALLIEEIRGALVMRGVLQTNAPIGKIILSGHSGGYRVMAAILDVGGLRRNIREAWLFDGLYADADKFQSWLVHSDGRLLNIYTDGGGTKDDSEAMMKWMEQNKMKFLATEESRATAGELNTNRVVFLHTDMSHNDVVAKRKTFQRFLEASSLNSYPPR